MNATMEFCAGNARSAVLLYQAEKMLIFAGLVDNAWGGVYGSLE
jgi:hypothetical protein